jgi:hypothetical protein
METVNTQQAQRVWQRVHGTQPEDSTIDPLPRLIAGEWESAAACLYLARRTGGKYAPTLRQLAQHSRSRWACLQGRTLLDTGKRPRHTHPAALSGLPAEILTGCCRDAQERIAQYSQCTQLGPLAPLLSQEQARDCRMLLEILGNWEL